MEMLGGYEHDESTGHEGEENQKEQEAVEPFAVLRDHLNTLGEQKSEQAWNEFVDWLLDVDLDTLPMGVEMLGEYINSHLDGLIPDEIREVSKSNAHIVISKILEGAPLTGNDYLVLGLAKALSILNMQIGDGGAVALANSENLSHFTSLNIYLSNIGDGGAIALASSEYLRNLTSLTLEQNRIGDAGAEALMRSESLTNLEQLDFLGNNISDEMQERLETLAVKRSLDIFF
jgi:hypothetical protein